MVHGLTPFVSGTRRPWATLRHALVGAVLALGATNPLPAQDGSRVEVVRQENFRASPNGVLLGTFDAGTLLDRVSDQGDWVEVEVGGWIWTRSMQIVDRDGFDLVISVDGGENLRARPQGPVLGRFVQGTLLGEEERIPGWVRVRRRGWIWAPSVRERSAPAPQASAAPGAGAADLDGPVRSPEAASGAPSPTPGDAPVGGAARGTPATPPRALLRSPDGDTLARVGPATEFEVVGRDGGWARVRLEGWVWLPDSADGAMERAEVGPGQVAAEPGRWRGRVVTWRLHFISLEEAEAVRTDFREGEPFLLTRASSERDAPFVYVAVPPELEARARELAPLEAISVTGRIRTGASALTGSPIVDLLELRRGAGR